MRMYWIQLVILPSSDSHGIFMMSSLLNLSTPSSRRLCSKFEARTSLNQSHHEEHQHFSAQTPTLRAERSSQSWTRSWGFGNLGCQFRTCKSWDIVDANQRQRGAVPFRLIEEPLWARWAPAALVDWEPCRCKACWSATASPLHRHRSVRQLRVQASPESAASSSTSRDRLAYYKRAEYPPSPQISKQESSQGCCLS